MESSKSIKNDIKQEFKYILHSRRNRKEIAIVGNLKSIQCTFTYPLFQCGDVVNYKAFFNIVLCLLSNGIMLPPLVLTTMVGSSTLTETPVLNVRNINFSLSSFQHWLKLVWQKRNRQNIRSLLVTSTHLPFGVARLLKKYNTELMILPDTITADIEPLNEEWSNEFISEVTKNYRVWGQEFNAVMFPLEIFCKIIHSAWNKCSTETNFDKLFLLDEDKEIVSILEEQFIHQKEWMTKLNLTRNAKLNFEIIEIFRCSSCANLFPIIECGRHALTEVTTVGSNVFSKYRRLVGIGGEAYFTCFIEHDDGTLICEICAEDFSRECWAAHHILKHLQQKWCRICFGQLFICQKHMCVVKNNEPPVFAQEEEGISASVLACEDQHVKSNHISYKKMSPEVLSSNTAKLLLTQHKGECVGNVSNGLEDIPLIEKQTSENTKDFSLNVHNKVYNSDVQSFPIQNCHEFVGTGKPRSSEHEDKNAHTFALNGTCSSQMPENNAVDEENSQKVDSNFFICDVQAKSSSEDLLMKKASLDSMYFQLLESLSKNEEYFLNENESYKCDINPQFFHMSAASIKETVVATKQGIPQDHDNVGKLISENNRFHKTLRTPDYINSSHNSPKEVPSAGRPIQVSSKDESIKVDEDNMCLSQDLDDMHHENNESNVKCVTTAKSSSCDHCDAGCSAPVEVATHVCGGIYNTKNIKVQINLPATKALQNSTINDFGTLCPICGTKLSSKLELINHVCYEETMKLLVDIIC